MQKATPEVADRHFGGAEAADRWRAQRHGIDVQGARHLRAATDRPCRPERSSKPAGGAFMTLASSLLSAVPGLRHAFFTREGGVSDGIYAASMAGSAPTTIRPMSRKTAAAWPSMLGVAPEHFLSLHQIHSPDVAGRRRALAERGRGRRATRMVTQDAGHRARRHHRRLRTGPVRRSQARVIGAAHAGWKGALTGVLESTIAAMEKLGADAQRHHRRDRPPDPAAQLRGRQRIRRALHRGRCGQRHVLHPVGARRTTRCSTSPASSGCGWKPPAS